MEYPRPLTFDSFSFDPATCRLARAGATVPLAPKAATLLGALITHAGRRVDKRELLDAVWPRQQVDESVLKTTVNQLRKVLGDDPRRPRYIETVPRRGYRFMLELSAAPDESNVQVTGLVLRPSRPEHLVRPAVQSAFERALARLSNLPQRRASEPPILLLVGEAGIGKSIALEGFVSALATDSRIRIARGQCAEPVDAREPYLPLLEALAGLCRDEPSLVGLLREVAPGWLVQLPWTIAPAERVALQRDLNGTGPGRLMREFAELIARLALERPLLWILEDLHWADHATLQLVGEVVKRRDDGAALWVAALRPAAAGVAEQGADDARVQWCLRGLAREVPIDPFDESQVQEYLGLRWPGQAIPPAVAARLHAQTQGLPLYMATLLHAADDLARRDAKFADPDADPSRAIQTWWDVQEEGLPPTLVQLIERQMRQLAPDDAALLEAAAVLGMDFWAYQLSELLERSHGGVRWTLDQLTREAFWLVALPPGRLSDGRFDGRASFRHALVRQAIYQRMSAATSAEWHRRAVACLVQCASLGIETRPADLALHCERSHDIAGAVQHGLIAARQSFERSAPTETLQFAGRALALLERRDRTDSAQPADDETSLELHMLVGNAAAQLNGVASPQALASYERARALCERLPPTASHGWVLHGLGWVLYMRAQYDEALTLAEKIETFAETSRERALQVAAWNLRVACYTYLGRYDAALDAMHRGMAVCGALENALDASRFVIDPIISMACNGALAVLQVQGINAAAEQLSVAAGRARMLDAPMGRMLVHWIDAALGACIGERARVAAAWALLRHEVTQSDLAQGAGPVRWFGAWLQGLATNDPDVAQRAAHHVIEGHDLHLRFGMRAGSARVLAYATEVALHAGALGMARYCIDRAQRHVVEAGERLGEPELHLLEARLHSMTGNETEARLSLQAAVRLAEASGARWVAERARKLIDSAEPATD